MTEGPTTPSSSPAGLPPGAVAVLLGALIGLSGTGTAAVAVAIPDLVGHFGVPLGGGVWVVSAYAITLAVGTPLYGRAADNAGVRTPLAIGVGLLSAGAVAAAVAPTYETLIAARFLQGAGAGAAPVLALATLRVKYVGPVRSRALGRLMGTAVAATACGPVAGGLLTELLGWQAAVLLPGTGLFLVAALWRSLPTAGAGLRLDYVGAFWVGCVATGLVLLVQAAAIGPRAALVGAALVLSAAPVAAARVRRRPDGFLPRSVVTKPAVLFSALGASALPASWFGLLVAIPAVLSARGWGPLAIGLALLPGAAAGVAMSRVVGPALDRFGACASLTMSAGACLLAVLVAALGATGLPVLLMAAMALVHAAFAVGQAAMSAAIAEAVPPSVDGVALGLANLLFFVGGGLGAAAAGLGSVVGQPWSLAILALIPLAATLVAPRARSATTGGR